MKRILIVLVVVALSGMACKDKETNDQPTATAPEAQQGDGPGETDDHDHDHAEGEEHFHLGGHMYEISRRFSTIWFAGQSGNAAMVKYQTHELEEVIEEIAEAKPIEHDVDVAKRLQTDVEAHFEKLEEQAASGDKKAFEATYRTVMNNCTTCHADTKHGFIQVKVPEYNPYPNLAY